MKTPAFSNDITKWNQKRDIILLLFLLFSRHWFFAAAANSLDNFVDDKPNQEQNNTRDGVGQSRLSVEHDDGVQDVLVEEHGHERLVGEQVVGAHRHARREVGLPPRADLVFEVRLHGDDGLQHEDIVVLTEWRPVGWVRQCGWSRANKLQQVREDVFAECHRVRLSFVAATEEIGQLAAVVGAHDVVGIVVVVPQVAVDVLVAIEVFAGAERVRWLQHLLRRACETDVRNNVAESVERREIGWKKWSVEFNS